MACQAVEVQMTTKTDSLNSRISSSYKQLTQAATELNAVSDELGKFVTALDAALRRLNLGIATWLRLESREDGSGNYTKRDSVTQKSAISGASPCARWPAITTTSKTPTSRSGCSTTPAALRIESVEKLPDLFENLVKEADAATKQIRTKTERAQALASALTEQRRRLCDGTNAAAEKVDGHFPMMKSKF
jgi:hypothetical protein